MRRDAKRTREAKSLLVVSEHHNLAQDITFHLIFWSILWALAVAFYLFLEIIKCI